MARRKNTKMLGIGALVAMAAAGVFFAEKVREKVSFLNPNKA